MGNPDPQCQSLPARRETLKRRKGDDAVLGRKLDYDALAHEYNQAIARLDIIEEYLVRMLELMRFRRYEP